MISIGFDPGYAITGWGVVDIQEQAVLDVGVIVTKKDESLAQRLAVIYKEARILIERFKPNIAIVEKLHFAQSKTTAVGVLQARGVIYAALGEDSIHIVEVSPKTVKKAMTGSGNASKGDVARMVELILKVKKGNLPDDAIDALAMAWAGPSMDKMRLSQ